VPAKYEKILKFSEVIFSDVAVVIIERHKNSLITPMLSSLINSVLIDDENYCVSDSKSYILVSEDFHYSSIPNEIPSTDPYYLYSTSLSLSRLSFLVFSFYLFFFFQLTQVIAYCLISDCSLIYVMDEGNRCASLVRSDCTLETLLSENNNYSGTYPSSPSIKAPDLGLAGSSDAL